MAKRKSTKGQTTEIEEKQTTRNWPKEKGQKDKQPSTKHTMAKRKSTKGQTTINKTYTMAIRKGTKGQIAIYKTCKN